MNLGQIDEKYAIYGMLFSLSNRIQTIGNQEFEEITMKQHFMLIALQMFQTPPTLKDMGELIGCSYQNVKRMAEQLQSNGFLVIKQDEKDKRKLRLVETEKVARFGRESMEKTVEFMSRMYDNISKEDLEITLQTLKKMDQNLGGVIE